MLVDWNPRESYLCVRCRSSARNRLTAIGLAEVLETPDLGAYAKAPNRDVYIAATWGGLLARVRPGSPRLATSDYIDGLAPGAPLNDGVSTCQNLEALTYEDESFDVVVTEDVLEHVRDVDACFAEINRVLRLGGRHVFTVPYYPDIEHMVRVDTSGPEDVKLMEDQWHGDPVRGQILAYRQFGYGIFDWMSKHGFETKLLRPTMATRRAGVFNTFTFIATKR